MTRKTLLRASLCALACWIAPLATTARAQQGAEGNKAPTARPAPPEQPGAAADEAAPPPQAAAAAPAGGGPATSSTPRRYPPYAKGNCEGDLEARIKHHALKIDAAPSLDAVTGSVHYEVVLITAEHLFAIADARRCQGNWMKAFDVYQQARDTFRTIKYFDGMYGAEMAMARVLLAAVHPALLEARDPCSPEAPEGTSDKEREEAAALLAKPSEEQQALMYAAAALYEGAKPHRDAVRRVATLNLKLARLQQRNQALEQDNREKAGEIKRLKQELDVAERAQRELEQLRRDQALFRERLRRTGRWRVPLG